MGSLRFRSIYVRNARKISYNTMATVAKFTLNTTSIYNRHRFYLIVSDEYVWFHPFKPEERSVFSIQDFKEGLSPDTNNVGYDVPSSSVITSSISSSSVASVSGGRRRYHKYTSFPPPRTPSMREPGALCHILFGSGSKSTSSSARMSSDVIRGTSSLRERRYHKLSHQRPVLAFKSRFTRTHFPLRASSSSVVPA